MILTPAQPDELKELQDLFVNTVSTVCTKDYTPEQIQAWLSGVDNHSRWVSIVTEQYAVAIKEQSQIIGFASLTDDSELDMLYVHKDHQNRGIAWTLYTEIEQEARRRGQSVIFSNVSQTARPFFEKMGFHVLHEQTVEIQGVTLGNYRMRKAIELTSG
ncbi:MAG: GNAT family N-acetyltransferase [Cytophagales bacterium]|nr:GNAT family N-acetyltransferase [Cytophagales bacterium]